MKTKRIIFPTTASLSIMGRRRRQETQTLSSATSEFFNSEPGTPNSELIVFANELSIQSDGWAQLAPYGDFPGQGFVRNADGTVTKFAAVQRMDRPAAEAMAAKF
ncbi:MAG: hypothetical protein JWR19_2931, partial [Pedosphaera sp.]|nr:hypothetical protein [Pedosphaera sp.]